MRLKWDTYSTDALFVFLGMTLARPGFSLFTPPSHIPSISSMKTFSDSPSVIT
jgi:hypothetical protein